MADMVGSFYYLLHWVLGLLLIKVMLVFNLEYRPYLFVLLFPVPLLHC